MFPQLSVPPPPSPPPSPPTTTTSRLNQVCPFLVSPSFAPLAVDIKDVDSAAARGGTGSARRRRERQCSALLGPTVDTCFFQFTEAFVLGSCDRFSSCSHLFPYTAQCLVLSGTCCASFYNVDIPVRQVGESGGGRALLACRTLTFQPQVVEFLAVFMFLTQREYVAADCGADR